MVLPYVWFASVECPSKLGRDTQQCQDLFTKENGPKIHQRVGLRSSLRRGGE